jgi:hypothetical protein
MANIVFVAETDLTSFPSRPQPAGRKMALSPKAVEQQVYKCESQFLFACFRGLLPLNRSVTAGSVVDLAVGLACSLATSVEGGFAEPYRQSSEGRKLESKSRRLRNASMAIPGAPREYLVEQFGLNIHAGNEQIVPSGSSTKMCSPRRFGHATEDRQSLAQQWVPTVINRDAVETIRIM